MNKEGADAVFGAKSKIMNPLLKLEVLFLINNQHSVTRLSDERVLFGLFYLFMLLVISDLIMIS